MRLVEPRVITLDRERRLFFDAEAIFSAQREINRLRGTPPADCVAIEVLVINALRAAVNSLGILPLDLMGVLLWAACLHEKDPKFTVSRAIDLVREFRFKDKEFTQALIDAWNDFWPSAKEEANGEDKKNFAEQTGLESGASRELN